MGYKRHAATLYVVSWDDAGIVKLGFTEHKRWRRFELRGGRVVGLVEFPHWSGALNLEGATHSRLRRTFPAAFTALAESTPYMGCDGAGWKECYQMHPSNADALLDRIAAEQCRIRTNGTHALTNDWIPPSDISPVRYAHDAKEIQR